MTDEEKQIEELARAMCDGCPVYNQIMCHEWYVAQKIYNAGYRKQIEGEWEEIDIPVHCEDDVDVVYRCSSCGNCSDSETNFCWYCGAKMKGGESE